MCVCLTDGEGGVQDVRLSLGEDKERINRILVS